jgi:lysophospholipase L1-like esterase
MGPIVSVLVAIALRDASVVQGQALKALPFASDIAAFKAHDQESPPARDQDLFIGSSSFTRWTDVQDYFPSHQILNRAFGGSTLLDEIRYVGDVVFPYEPKQVVIYCGENDFAADPKLAPRVVYGRFVRLFGLIRHQLPTTPIAYVSMKPSPSRWGLAAKFIAANTEIREFLAGRPNTAYIDVWPVMLNDQGQPKPEIYVADKLHMNATGYKLWAPLIEPVLK